MASIQRIPSTSKNWLCSLKLSNGKRTFRSTGLPATEKYRAEAQALCEQWQRIENGLAEVPTAEALKFENPREVAEGLITASRKLMKGEFTETDARALLDKMLKAGRQDSLSHETTKTVLESWLRGKELSKSKRTAKRYYGIVSLFLEHLGKKADLPLSSLTVRDIESFRDARLKAKLSARTVSLDLKIIRGILDVAVNQGIIIRNPAKACELPTGGENKRETFTPEEVQKLLSTPNTEWKTAILLGYYLGARLEDAVSMTWEDIDLSEGVIRYIQRKTKRAVTAPLHPDLKSHLLTIVGDAPKCHLTPTLASRAGKGNGNLSKQFSRIMEGCGIDREVSSSGIRAFSKKSFHSLRHSFTSHLANAGVSDEIRMQLTGHSSEDVHRRYTHLELNPLREAIKKLPSLTTE